MKFCDENLGAWASEAIKILQKFPGKSRYHGIKPDFLFQYKDKKGNAKVELIEIK